MKDALFVTQPLVVECDVPGALIGWIGCIAVLFTVLFADFYIKEYRKKGIKQVRLYSLNACSVTLIYL